MDAYIELLRILLTELLITHFDLTGHPTEREILHPHFEEKPEITMEEYPAHSEQMLAQVKERSLKGGPYYANWTRLMGMMVSILLKF